MQKKTNYFYLSSSSCANVIKCAKVKVTCKFKQHTVKKFLLAKKNSYMGWPAFFFFGGTPKGWGVRKQFARSFSTPPPSR